MSIIDRERIDYSPTLPGERGNYDWPVRFDMGGTGYLGISQFEDTDGGTKDRVLLSPKQVKALLAFVGDRTR